MDAKIIDEQVLDLTVADIMTRKIYAAGGDDPVGVVLGRIRGHGFHHMPVVDDRGELIGVVSDRDLLAAVDRDPDERVRDVMTHLTVFIRPETSAREAAERLIALKVGCLPVLDEGRLAGMITTTDFLYVAQRALLLLEMMSRGETPPA